MKLIVGLGNPDNQYAKSRHNIGFMCVAHFAKARGWPFEKKEGLARTAHGSIEGEEIVLARPQTFMNASGEAVQRLAMKYHVKPADIIVIHDEMDLGLGNIRIRLGGSSAGHNGIESIIRELGTPDFVRVRVGVGHPTEPSETGRHVISHVLGDFDNEESKTIEKVIAEVDKAIVTLIQDGLETAMNRFNRTNSPRVKKSAGATPPPAAPHSET